MIGWKIHLNGIGEVKIIASLLVVIGIVVCVMQFFLARQSKVKTSLFIVILFSLIVFLMILFGLVVLKLFLILCAVILWVLFAWALIKKK